MDKQTSATSACTPSLEVGVLMFGTDNINAKHDNIYYSCCFTMGREEGLI